MNKSELKSFATFARRELLEKVALRAKGFGMDEKNNISVVSNGEQLLVNGIQYPTAMRNAFQSLQSQYILKGYDQLIEEVAYTWFNRIIAIRYMEIHEYLPERVHVLSSSIGKVEPDILLQYQSMDLEIDKSEVRNLLERGEIEEAYSKLLIAQCNALQPILPFLFEKIDDFTALLLPNFLMDNESVISKLVNNIELTTSFSDVEVIGWLYQYYISDKKVEVGGLDSKEIAREHLPIVTQLFTPSWIVKYMVQNSLGNLYDTKIQESNLSSTWEYYIKREPTSYNIFSRLEEIKFIDPACGSGHILVYAFELFYQMYIEQGYFERDIPRLIIENNLFGLDIDRRAIQIANFAIAMKAVEKYPRYLKRESGVKYNIVEIIDSVKLSEGAINLIATNEIDKLQIEQIVNAFKDGKQYGSLSIVPEIEYKKIIDKIVQLEENSMDDLLNLLCVRELKEKLLPVLQQGYLLSRKYDVVAVNPPYHNKYNATLKNFMQENYSDYKTDLYSAFIYRSCEMTSANGYCAMMTPFTWMFNSTQEKTRKYIIGNFSINSFVQLEYHAFFEEANVPICTFVIQNQKQITIGEYIKLSEFTGDQATKVREALIKKVNYRYSYDSRNFLDIPGAPISYWADESIRKSFKENRSLAEIAEPKVGLQTGDNDRFLKYWYEVPYDNIGFFSKDHEEALLCEKKWFPYNKGGAFRKWYGNQEYVVNWENNGEKIKSFPPSVIRNQDYYFREGITWTTLTISAFSARYSPPGFLFDTKGSTLFTDENIYLLLGIIQSKVLNVLLSCLNETMDYGVGQLSRLPIVLPENKEAIIELVRDNIGVAKEDWDSSEKSWEFRTHPIVKFKEAYLEDSYKNYLNWSNSLRGHLRQNEETINILISDIYNLNHIGDTSVSGSEITLFSPDRTKDVKSLLSYFIGCIMGRYSLDIEGIAFAGGEFNWSKYKKFVPVKYGIISITDELYFEDDIISRLREFLAVTFSPDTVDQNLRWLAESLRVKKNETAEARLRRYFCDEFFKDHCQLYQKHPIYWLVDSGSRKGLRTFIYIHRYQPDTLATIRFEHLQVIQAKYLNEINTIDLRISNPSLPAIEKRALEKKKEDFQKRIEELTEFDKMLAKYANTQIEVDLDDGVKVNYEIFKGVLAKI